MGGSRQAGFLALLVLVYLPAALANSEFAYRFRLSSSARFEVEIAGERLDMASRRIGPWEITVAFDPSSCTVSCVYRRVANGGAVLPPATTIRVYDGAANRPQVLQIDPWQRHRPRADSSATSVRHDAAWHQQLFAPARAHRVQGSATSRVPGIRLPEPPAPVSHNTPLRI